MCVEVRKRVLTLTDNMYLNSYLTSMNCVRGKEHKYANALADNPDPKFMEGNHSTLEVQYDLAKKSSCKRQITRTHRPRKQKRRRKNKKYNNDDAKY